LILLECVMIFSMNGINRTQLYLIRDLDDSEIENIAIGMLPSQLEN
jgi:hypothetical protein